MLLPTAAQKFLILGKIPSKTTKNLSTKSNTIDQGKKFQKFSTVNPLEKSPPKLPVNY